jgi:hypothetical protein
MMGAHRDELDSCDDDRPPYGAWDRFVFRAIVILLVLFAGAVWADTALFGRPGEMGHANGFVVAMGIGGPSLFVRWLFRRR